MNPRLAAPSLLAALFALAAPAAAGGAGALHEAGRILDEAFPAQAGALEAVTAAGAPAEAAGVPADSRPAAAQEELDRQLLQKCRYGNRADYRNLKEAGELIGQGADPNAKTETGVTGLMMAAGLDNAPLMRLLLKHGAAVNSQEDRGMTALWIAVQGRAAEALEVLGAAKGLDADLAERGGSTPLGLAVERGDLQVAGFLLDHGAGIDLPFFPALLAATNSDKRTPLMIASWIGDWNMVKFLLGRKAGVNIKSANGATALSLAREVSDRDIREITLKLLRDAGAKE